MGVSLVAMHDTMSRRRAKKTVQLRPTGDMILLQHISILHHGHEIVEARLAVCGTLPHTFAG
jgi:hypothetical protein